MASGSTSVAYFGRSLKYRISAEIARSLFFALDSSRCSKKFNFVLYFEQDYSEQHCRILVSFG